MNVGGGENDFTDKIIKETHAEEIQFRFLCYLVPTIVRPPPRTVDDVVICPPRAKGWNSVFILHWVGRGGFSILWEGLVVVVHLYSLRTKLVDLLTKSCATKYVWHNIMNGGTVHIDRGGVRIHHSRRHLAFKDSLGVDIDLEILLHNVKSNPFTKLRNCHKIAHLLLPLANPPLPLPSDHSTIDAMLHFGGPSLVYSLPRMEKSCHGRANGSGSATTASSCHRRKLKNGADHQYSSTIPTYSYVGMQGTTHNVANGRCAINNIFAGAGDQ